MIRLNKANNQNIFQISNMFFILFYVNVLALILLVVIGVIKTNIQRKYVYRNSADAAAQ